MARVHCSCGGAERQGGVQMSALHIAARAGQVLALYKLIAEKCQDVNVVDLWGQTPLDHAVACDHLDCCLILICQGGATTYWLLWPLLPLCICGQSGKHAGVTTRGAPVRLQRLQRKLPPRRSVLQAGAAEAAAGGVRGTAAAQALGAAARHAEGLYEPLPGAVRAQLAHAARGQPR